MKLLYPLNIKNDIIFTPTPRDFTVEEIPLYEFSGEGEHLVLKVRKKELTTWELIGIFARFLGIKNRDIGYAGLKDKYAMTIQYISLPAKFEEKLATFAHDKIKILDATKHNNKIRVGHLKGNRFELRLKKVLGIQRDKLDSALEWIKEYGIPNYFGNQRFGNDGNNWEEGKKILEGTMRVNDPKTREFLVGSYQSYLFNSWLSKRVELSLLFEKFNDSEVEKILELPVGSLEGVKKQKHFFKVLKGDMMMHYPYGRVFEAEDINAESQRFFEKDTAPTGLIPGKRVSRATDVAGMIEAKYDEEINADGSRRYAWIRVEDIKTRYVMEKAHYELSFVLPKGSYATNVVDVLRG
jgi:tRNA pseudouridine13 synthase